MDIEKINKIVKTDIKEGLKQIYPEVFEDNKINFEKLKSLLSGEIIEKEDDRFYFNWAGKSTLYKLIQSPAYGTLKPDKEKSIDFDNTENIVIVGENLETLKLLLKPYFGKVKMIYIDPPYNIGKDKDRIYRDNFKEPLKDYLEKTGQIDSIGKKLTTNPETNGRFHSDWLNSMYTRLFLARNLLRDDGVIFVSIDDHEVHHLRMIMDEIFGEENFSCEFIWEKKKKPSFLHKNVGKLTEYILCYVKDVNNTFPFSIDTTTVGKKYPINNAGNNLTTLIFPPNSVKFDLPDQTIKPQDMSEGNIKTKLLEEVSIKNGKNENQLVLEGEWRYSQEKLNEIIAEGDEIRISKIPFRPNHIKKGGEIKKMKNVFSPNHYEMETNEDATSQIISIFGKEVFDNPKPVKLIKTLIKGVTYNENNCLILDFFAGTGTTGHAVWDLNKEDGGNRKFILVQIDEEVENAEIKKDFPSVADICIERLKRVSEKYKQENNQQFFNKNHDFGSKVFRLARSNFNLKDEFEVEKEQDVEELKKKYLEWLGRFVDQPLVSGWKKIDVIYEVMLKEGLNLNSKIEKVKIKENDFYYVKDTEQDLDFYVNLENQISTETIEEIRTSKYKGKMFVFLDNALTDSDKINLRAFVRLKVI